MKLHLSLALICALLFISLENRQAQSEPFNCVVTEKNMVTCVTIEPFEHRRGLVEIPIKDWGKYPEWWLVSDGPNKPLRKVQPKPGQLLKARRGPTKLIPIASCEVQKRGETALIGCDKSPSKFVQLLMEVSKGSTP